MSLLSKSFSLLSWGCLFQVFTALSPLEVFGVLFQFVYIFPIVRRPELKLHGCPVEWSSFCSAAHGMSGTNPRIV